MLVRVFFVVGDKARKVSCSETRDVQNQIEEMKLYICMNDNMSGAIWKCVVGTSKLLCVVSCCVRFTFQAHFQMRPRFSEEASRMMCENV